MSFLSERLAYIEAKLNIDVSHYDEWWSQSSFLRQLMDIYPEAYRLLDCTTEDELDAQWRVLDEFCNQTYADPSVDRYEKEELAEAQFDLYCFFMLKDTSISKEAAFSWWKQWKYSVNPIVAYAE